MLTKSKANPTMNKYSWDYLHWENSPGYFKSLFFPYSVAGKARIK